jgi:hypothetical protein
MVIVVDWWWPKLALAALGPNHQPTSLESGADTPSMLKMSSSGSLDPVLAELAKLALRYIGQFAAGWWLSCGELGGHRFVNSWAIPEAAFSEQDPRDHSRR